MSKKLCEWGKSSIDKKREKLVEIVQAPHYLCKKCARVAGEKKHLCRPDALNA
jgi:hypothetical protein